MARSWSGCRYGLGVSSGLCHGHGVSCFQLELVSTRRELVISCPWSGLGVTMSRPWTRYGLDHVMVLVCSFVAVSNVSKNYSWPETECRHDKTKTTPKWHDKKTYTFVEFYSERDLNRFWLKNFFIRGKTARQNSIQRGSHAIKTLWSLWQKCQ